MDPAEHCLVLIPCRDEAATIGAIVREVLVCLPQVLVLDDGSRDGTGVAAREAGAEVLRLAGSGKGLALRAGMDVALGRGFSWVLTLDGDGQHLPAEIPRLLDCQRETRADLVIGNRMAGAGAMPALRRRVNRLMSALISGLCGEAIPDSQCGFRLVRLDRQMLASLRAEHFEIESDLLMAAARADWRVAHTRVSTVYHGGGSHIRPMMDTVRWLGWLARQVGRPEPRVGIPAHPVTQPAQIP